MQWLITHLGFVTFINDFWGNLFSIFIVVLFVGMVIYFRYRENYDPKKVPLKIGRNTIYLRHDTERWNYLTDPLRKHAVKLTAKPITPENLDRAIRITTKELAKYPDILIKNHLKFTHVANTLAFDESPIAGTLSLNSIYVAVADHYSDTLVACIIHHEFSSIFLYQFADKDFYAKWEAINDENFSYFGTGFDAIKEGCASGEIAHESVIAEGFLTQYSKASVEEDFNMLAETSMATPELMQGFVRDHDKIKHKYKLWLGLMKKASPKFESPLEYY